MDGDTNRHVNLLAATFIIALLSSPVSLADGTETLGPPKNIAIAAGTGIIAAGVGLEDPSGEKKIEFAIPAGAVVKQVLIYWEGQTPENGPVDVTFDVNGIPIALVDPGNASADPPRIGEPIYFYTTDQGQKLYSIAYRHDITSFGAVQSGNNTLIITGLDGFGFVTDGAGVMVIYEEPNVPASIIQLRDGIDLAYHGFEPPRDATAEQVFAFPAAEQERVATLSLFFSSVAGAISGGGPLRPSSIEITTGGLTTTYGNLLASNNGQEWDTQNFLVNIPAGATSLKVQAFSRDDQPPVDNPPDPASFFWLAAGFSIPPAPPKTGDGCTPGYWKQPHHFGNWPPSYTPATMFSDVFEDAFPGKTLLQVLGQGGGGLIALGRHTVAALLNGGSDKVNYDLSGDEVIQYFNDVYPGTKDDYQKLHTLFADLNERRCPLGRAELAGGLFNRGNVDMTKPGLMQNFPNPFNPTTRISFVVPEAGAVTLRVYNMLGQDVRTLAEGVLTAGIHTVEWDGSGDRGNQLPSGVYICKLQAGTYIEIRKMTLMR